MGIKMSEKVLLSKKESKKIQKKAIKEYEKQIKEIK